MVNYTNNYHKSSSHAAFYLLTCVSIIRNYTDTDIFNSNSYDFEAVGIITVYGIYAIIAQNVNLLPKM